MVKLSEIISFLENYAPKSYQESYDNSGLLLGNAATEVSGVLISLDCTEDVVQEAIDKNCNAVVAHHPIVFKGIKQLTGKNYAERTILKAIKNDIALYAIHTNLDHVWNGVNHHIAQKLALKNVRILAPKTQILQKLTTFVPNQHHSRVLEALWAAGAGQIGNYQNCSFSSQGTGTYMPNASATPYKGEAGVLEYASEMRVEVIYPAFLQNKIIKALKENHPYEEVAYYLHTLENAHQDVGAGAIGELDEPMSEQDFMKYLKEKMELKCFKHTPLLGKKIKKVALCGGSGVFLLQNAISNKADIFVTSDVKYHEFFDADQNIILADIGHYESEIFTKDLIFNVLSEKFSNIALKISDTHTNPVQYIF